MFESVIQFIVAGILFGLSGGFAPGPIMTIVIAQAVQHDWKEGAKVAIAPLLTDGPIIVIGVCLLSLFREWEWVLGVVSLLGAVFLGYLAYESWTVRGIQIDVQQVKPRSVLKGVVANLLNPSPYMFWFSIGCPMIIKAAAVNNLAVGAFTSSFFAGLVGTKVIIALVAASFRGFLETRGYVYLMRFLGLLLLVYAFLFAWDGLQYLT